MRRMRIFGLWLAIVVELAGCNLAITPSAPAAPAATTELTVFAAASLTDAFNEIGKNFEAANPGVKLTFNYAGSQQLAQQLGQGAPADVFASANGKQMDVAIQAGRIVTGTAHTFARNRLVVIAPKDNQAQIKTLQDLAKPGLKLIFAAKEVPVGQYALDFLDKATKDGSMGADYKTTVLANVVSYEDNVRSVLAKITLGEGDAGIVYSTDTYSVTDKVQSIAIPDNLNTLAAYPIAAVTDSKHFDLAKKFADYTFTTDAQTVLVKYGFIPTTGSATGAAPAALPVEISGLVDKPQKLGAADLAKMEQTEVKATDRDGKKQTIKGVLLSAILTQVGLQSAAKSVVFTGGDGYSQEVTLADLQKDTNAIITVDEGGSLRNVLPSTKPKFWVKGLVKLEVK